MEKIVKTAEEIKKLSYTDFVGWVNQWNVLPGSYCSLNKWRVFGDINSNSRILEVACTTGFSSREISRMTRCSGTGIDISGPSVEAAIVNKTIYAPNANIDYMQADGYEFNTDETFTHIIFGAALRFFPDPAKMLKHSLSFLGDKGYILSTEFYTVKPIPEDLIKEAETVFGITPTTVSYKDVMKIYEGLNIFYEDKNVIELETEDELKHYTDSTINRACKELDIVDEDVRKIMYDRLYAIKDMSNRLRPYQNYNVLVMQYDKEIYPNRFVELF